MIYLAPLQGFTDFVYRKNYAEHFSGIDSFFIPYISIKNDKILDKYIREILPENNPKVKTVPQVLAKNSRELLFLAGELKKHRYTEINLNMGCPYPMISNRGKGAGLLAHPKKLGQMLDDFFSASDLKLSVKIRAGLTLPTEIEQLLPVFNSFPLTEIIFHPRVASQLYEGDISEPAFLYAVKNSHHRLVYNGDIFSPEEFNSKKFCFPKISNWMMGRGILMNPFLPSEINGQQFSAEEKRLKLTEFQQHIFESYLEYMDNPGNALNKIKQFWIYYSHNFREKNKVLKLVKKIKSADNYQEKSQEIMSAFLLAD